MIKGLGTGMLSGGVVGAVVMSGLSLYSPLPQDRIDAAPKLQATQSQPETAPATAQTSTVEAEQDSAVVADTQASTAATVEPAGESAQNVETPIIATSVAEETTNAAPVATTETASNAASETVRATDTSVAAEAATEATTETAQQVTPEVTATAEVDTNVAATEDTAPFLEGNDAEATRVQPSGLASERIVGEEKVEETEASPSETVVAETTQDAEDAPLQIAAVPPKPAPALPTITTPKPATTPEPVSADTPIVLPTPKVPGVVTNRLPSVSGAASTPQPVAEAVVAAPEVATDLGALAQFATPTDGIDGKSLMSFVLIDTGEDGVPRKDLVAMSIPITIAIDPVMENAAAIMAEYRAAGIEVVAIANDLPVAAGPGDVATAVSAYFDVLNQSVALMDPLDARIQSNRSLLQPILGSIRDTGHGLITYDRGLNTAQQAAQRENIPAATVFRILDADLESAPKIKRYLDRAAFAANQDGTVVVVGRSYPDTVQALVEWSLEKKDASIAVVPVSAVMLAGGAS